MISQRTKEELNGSVCIRDIFEEGKRMANIYGAENIFNFSIGNPSVEPPAIVNESMKKVLDSEEALTLHGYPANAGYPDVRAHVAEYLNKTYDCSYDWNGVLMTAGAASAIVALGKAILDPEDEVIAFAPYFWEYENYIGVVYGKLVAAQCDMETLQPDPATFEAAFTPRTKFVLLNTPNNPTGAVYTEESIRTVARIMEEKQREYGHPIYLVSDEPYRKLSYDIEVPYVAHYYRNTIVIYSYSKTLSIPGERIGYIAVEPCVDDYEELLSGLTMMIRHYLVNAPTLQQRMLMYCVDATVDIDIYRRTRDTLYEGLQQIGYTCIHPDGAFYMFVKSLEEDDQKFCDVAKEEKILLAPGSAFQGPGWVRISYCVPNDVVRRSMPGFRRLYERYRGKGAD